MAVIFVLIIVLGIFLCGWLLHLITSSYAQVIADLKSEQAALAKRLEELENAARKSRNPYLTNAGLEDAIAVALDLEETVHYADIRNQVLQGILKKIRTDPGGYNEDAPNGKREIGGIK